MIVTILLTLLFCYVLLVILLIVGWNRAMSRPLHAMTAPESPLSITVLVPARNEESTILDLLRDLSRQHYPDFEVIIIDDDSDDRTFQVCLEVAERDHRFSIFKCSGTGKKSALTEGVRKSKGSLIVTTDADCRVGANWLSALAKFFENPSTKLCFGGVTMTGSTWFERWQSVEFATLVGTGAATAAFNIPTMCNAANLAYRKSTFEAVGGYNDNLQIPSGDDEFLMRKIHLSYPRSIRYCQEPDAVVSTRPSSDLKSFFSQRLRWAGKWKSNTDTTAKLLAVFVFSFHVGVVMLPWLVAAQIVSPMAAVVALLMKMVSELIFLWRVRSALTQYLHWDAFVALQVVYSYYVVIVAVCAPFSTFDWKGRRLKPFTDSGQ